MTNTISHHFHKHPRIRFALIKDSSKKIFLRLTHQLVLITVLTNIPCSCTPSLCWLQVQHAYTQGEISAWIYYMS